MRLCQPGPPALKCAITSGLRRIETGTLVDDGTCLALAMQRAVPGVTADRRFAEAAARVTETTALVKPRLPATG